VARPLGGGADETGSWLITTVLPGQNAVSPRWLADPRTAVTMIGRGLRALHESLPVAGCPFSWAASDRVAVARRCALDPACWHEEHQPLGVARALELVSDVPPVDRLVVCHGDACAPNTMLADDGQWSAHVDLGSLGVADRWADLAVATWSTEWNYGTGWAGVLLDAYGVEPDPARSEYYRLLWDLDP
jgi:kanamycin kinase